MKGAIMLGSFTDVLSQQNFNENCKSFRHDDNRHLLTYFCKTFFWVCVLWRNGDPLFKLSGWKHFCFFFFDVNWNFNQNIFAYLRYQDGSSSSPSGNLILLKFVIFANKQPSKETVLSSGVAVASVSRGSRF